ncbi:MAG: hypothetical protein KGZ85_11665 [Ignavibacterium sp.]|nr:hypothetical protein [Ignavibacterium sp.]
MKQKHILVILLLLVSCLTLQSQEDPKSSETSWNVPELFAFHDVIYQIWHTAFPNKDIKMLKGFKDDVNAGAEKIFEIKLSGILRDKEEKWKEGTEKLRSSVESYNRAATSDDDQSMLNAAEDLHSDFEMLVRIIKPMSKEIDDYHQTLYMIYHYYYPEKDYIKLKEASSDLYGKAGIIKSSDIPGRALNKKDEYLYLVENLFTATEEFMVAAQNNDLEKIDDLIEEVHNKYQELEHLFD